MGGGGETEGGADPEAGIMTGVVVVGATGVDESGGTTGLGTADGTEGACDALSAGGVTELDTSCEGGVVCPEPPARKDRRPESVFPTPPTTPPRALPRTLTCGCEEGAPEGFG